MNQNIREFQKTLFQKILDKFHKDVKLDLIPFKKIVYETGLDQHEKINQHRES
jgi:hypothetical protein